MVISVPKYGVKLMATHIMTISRLAAAAGVHVETVRYYQRRGLLPEPERPMGSVRRYGPNEVGRLQFIRRAQAMGFSLDEIAGLLEVKGQRACEQTRRLTEKKLAEVRRRLDELRQLEVDLEHLVEECRHVVTGAPVSYTHLDVYKRQPADRRRASGCGGVQQPLPASRVRRLGQRERLGRESIDGIRRLARRALGDALPRRQRPICAPSYRGEPAAACVTCTLTK